VYLFIHGVAFLRIAYIEIAQNGKHNNRHFEVKLVSEFFDAKLIVCITFPDKHGGGSTQASKFGSG
jgi:hypothetical protein